VKVCVQMEIKLIYWWAVSLDDLGQDIPRIQKGAPAVVNVMSRDHVTRKSCTIKE
jgi:hypothetical protein